MEITSYLLGKKAGEGTQPIGTINITENGKTNVSGYATADVNVQPTLQNKSVSITSNGSTSVSADENYDGLDTVSITTNVQPNLETKSITITENTTTTITPTTGKDGLSSVEVITNVSGGVAPIVREKDVNYYDYDGAVVYSYTKSEFLALTEHPENPTHSGLTAQGWNWELSDAKTFVTDYDKLNIGQNYITSDGATRLYVTITDGLLDPYVGIGLRGTATIDWGDNTTPDTITGTSTGNTTNTQHIYAQTGDYVITITPNSDNDKINIVQNQTRNKTMLVNNGNYSDYGYTPYCNIVKRIELGRIDWEMDNTYRFANLKNLETITIPDNLTSIGTGHFSDCNSLKCIIFPKRMTSITMSPISSNWLLRTLVFPKNMSSMGMYGYSQLTSLHSIIFPTGTYNTIYPIKQDNSTGGSLEYAVIPSNVTSLPDYMFQNQNCLKEVKLPNTITSIGESAFSGCELLSKINIPTGVTSLPNSCFNGCRSIFEFKIPANVTSMGNYCFGNNYYTKKYDFSDHTTIPTITDNTFSSIPNTCKIVVPDDLYEDWIVAQYWSSYANRIVKASEV